MHMRSRKIAENLLKYGKQKYYFCNKIISEKRYFCNYIFRKFKMIVYSAPLLYEVERNTFLNFDSITDRVKSKTWNLEQLKMQAL